MASRSIVLIMTCALTFLLLGCRPSLAEINEADFIVNCAGEQQPPVDAAVHAQSPHPPSPPKGTRKLGSSGGTTPHDTVGQAKFCYTEDTDTCNECLSKAADKISRDCASVGGLGSAHLLGVCFLEFFI